MENSRYGLILGVPERSRVRKLISEGVFWGTNCQCLSGALSKPTLRAVPGNVVTIGNQVAFFCEGPSEAKEYRLYKVGSQDYLIPTALLEIENKAKFSISLVQWHNAGQYWCSYTSTNGTSENSDILDLVVTGNRTLP